MREQRSPVLRADDIVSATAGRLIHGAPESIFQGLTTDSRALQPGNLFIPLVGEKFDGHDFIGDAVRAGASGVLVQRDREGKLGRAAETVAVIVVEDTLRALGDIARFWRKLFPIPVIAVTGSSGKTTTKEMIGHILGLGRKVHKNQGNFNNLVGLPLTLFGMNGSHEAAVLEMGTNRRGEIGRLTEIAAPDVGVITNIGPAHLKGFGSLDAVREEKGDLFRVMGNNGIAVINGDDENVGLLAKRWDGERITFGFDGRAFVRAEGITPEGPQGISFLLRVGELKGNVSLATVGEHNVRNALAAAAASWAVGTDFETLRRGLQAFRPVPGRMAVRRLKNGAFLIDDSYNANPASVKEALKTLRDQQGKHRSIAVLGDMLELGEAAADLHEEIGRAVADSGVDTLFVKGAYARAVASGAASRGLKEERIVLNGATEEISAWLKARLGPQDWVLVKGSRGMKMDEVVEAVIRDVGLSGDSPDRDVVVAGE